MKNKFIRILPIAIIGVALLSGCATLNATESFSAFDESSLVANGLMADSTTDEKKSEDNAEKTYDDYFSDRDISGEIDSYNAVEITFDEQSISANSDGVTVEGSTVTITKEGTYIISGTLSDGNIVVNTSKEDKVQLVLDGVSITSKTFAPIYVVQADKVFVTLKEGTTSTLTNGGSFIQIDDNNVDAVIYSKDDITLNGTGKLNISSPAGKGITGKDEVTITDGTYEIMSSDTAIRANDSVAIADGTFTIITDNDGIHAEKSDDDSLGEIYISGGSFIIKAKDDGIHGTTTLVIDGGTYDITAAEGLESTVVTINDGKISIEASDDGINAAKKSSLYSPKVEINGGNITIVMGAGDTDGVDANGDIIINGGTINVTGGSTFDYDGEGIINGGTVISNGEEITTLPNQMMGGREGMKRQKDGMDGKEGDMKKPFDGMKEPFDGMEEPNTGMREHKDGMRRPKDEINGQEEGKGLGNNKDI